MEGISRQVKYQRKHKALGLCQICSRKAVPDRTFCIIHLQKHAVATALWREKAKAKEEYNEDSQGL